MLGFGSSAKHGGVVVGWIAGREHAIDSERVPVVEALRRLLATHENMKLITLGVRLPLESERYEHVADVPFPRLLTVAARLDIGIAPLADTPFNHSRSNVKLKEYASARAAWAASPVGPYRGLGERQGGVLVEDDDWYAALDRLIRSPRERRRLARHALRWAKHETIDRHAEEWEHAFRGALEMVGARTASR
jgi:Glycosyl transferases group 1